VSDICMQTSWAKDLREKSLRMLCGVQLGHLMRYSSRTMDERAYNYIEKVDPRMWSRHAFRTNNCSDILLNSIVESFNAWVLEAREKPILTCMDIIRRQLMNRFN